MPAQIYRIKITLQHIAPPIWRRIEVPGNVTLANLHNLTMGWDDCHLWSFEIGKIAQGSAKATKTAMKKTAAK